MLDSAASCRTWAWKLLVGVSESQEAPAGRMEASSDFRALFLGPLTGCHEV